MPEKLIKTKQFIKQMGLDPSSFLIENVDTGNPILIDFPDMIICNTNTKDFNLDNFNEELGQNIVIDGPTKFFYNKKYEVVSSTWDKVIIKITDELFAKLYKNVVYEWDDCK